MAVSPSSSEGAGIDQEGYIAAPLGSISLSAPNGRVYLGSGSTTTVAAGNAALLYGAIQIEHRHELSGQ